MPEGGNFAAADLAAVERMLSWRRQGKRPAATPPPAGEEKPMPQWQRPTRCDNSGPNCVEVAAYADGTRRVRNSTSPDTVLEFTADEWAAFESSVRDGQSF